MQSVDFGRTWNLVVIAWFKYEEKHAFDQKGSRLGSKHRPSVISRWIQLARKNYRPDSHEMAGFENDFWHWWNHLQLSWRTVDPHSTPRTIEGSWEDVDRHGVNGLYSVIGALYLWRSFVEEKSLSSWNCAAEDVCWVLSQLVEID